ncbi:FecCD family ABC transporter permease [Streptomyces clavuligerus]|uniref:Iron-siderophore uptake system transmembrane component n=1 Tax=Streptomyces clavuligerus TaxID=1901 RepID=D5SJE9_STRCL|nr:iron chelate uptake ABC transporter family permease subunit [Streptomyces clavuligerus]EFG04042.1 Iron-siderophore uptake system transmembrane component [Streptomyces clavuligerus]MBY6307468.1 iron chelate uptake ABC transporter family permease subunit [Streptomyces clavuligerus]QCS09972.1 iron ABC transporter [Streptomyces clavuligerus]QPJ97985.1 iron chelate uptake ABC transporter family permease subunit [Streptomyces clavuligerus]WDN56679.1 iron chelate uptake ABC transporter family perm
MTTTSGRAVAPPRSGRSPAHGLRVLRVGRFSLLWHRRSAAVAAVLLLVLASVMTVSASAGQTWVPPGEVYAVLRGADSPSTLLVAELRVPRIVLGALVGTALGLAGALVQSVTRNPLASPDVIGVGHGAAAATVFALATGVTASPNALPLVSVAGGLVAAGAVWAIAWRGSLRSSRFVLTGVGIGVVLSAVVQLYLTESELEQAELVKLWLTGSLNGRGWDQAVPLAAVLLLTLPALLWATRALGPLGLGAETATALGFPLQRAQLGLTVIGVVLAASATGAAGPIGFVALTAPQLALRLTRTPQLPLVCSGLVGAVTLTAADLAARTVLTPLEVPVGALTALVGAPYLLWLLGRSGK